MIERLDFDRIIRIIQYFHLRNIIGSYNIRALYFKWFVVGVIRDFELNLM